MKAISVRINDEYEQMFNKIKQDYENYYDLEISDTALIKRLIKKEYAKIRLKERSNEDLIESIK